MNFLNKNTLAFLILLAALVLGCQDPWDERSKINDDVPQFTIMEEISSRPELSEFASLLQESGWDSILSSSKLYTVWAPTNDALALVSSDILNDPEQVKDFVNNHICFLQYEYFTKKEPIRVKTFREKYLLLDFVAGTVNDINLKESDIVANNGVLHTIEQALVPQLNVWEFIETTTECPRLVNYIKSMSGTVFDPTIATKIGVDPISGKPIYDTATGLIWNNEFLNLTRDLTSEEIESTVILFSDIDFDAEFTKFRPYYSVNQFPEDDISDGFIDDTAASDSLTEWKITKDIVFPGKVLPDELPAFLISTFGVKVPIGSYTITSNYNASNGMVYIVENYYVDYPDKIPVIIIEGEDTGKVVGRDAFGRTGFTRLIELASGGADFVLDNHGGNPGSLTYHVPGLCNMYYKVSWKVVNDFNYSYASPNPNDSIKQMLGWVKVIDYQKGEPIFSDVALGEIGINGGGFALNDTSYITAPERFIRASKINGYQRKEWIQISSKTLLNGVNLSKNRTIAVDYIKLEPVFN